MVENLTAVVLSALPVSRLVMLVANGAIIHSFVGLLFYANQQVAPTGPKWLQLPGLDPCWPVLRRPRIGGSFKGSSEGNAVHVLIDSGASENFVDTDVVQKLGLPIAGRATSIGMASSEVSMQTLGKVSGILRLMDRQYPNASFHVMPKLYADVIVGR